MSIRGIDGHRIELDVGAAHALIELPGAGTGDGELEGRLVG
jgi:hypothetical protein